MIQKRVMIRFPQVGRDTVLRPAEVLATTGTTLKVRVENEVKTREVDASETVPMSDAMARQFDPGHVALPVRCYPTAAQALGNR